MRQVDHIRGSWNPKRKLGVTTHFSEITALSIFSPNQKLIVYWVGLLLSFSKTKSRGYHSFLEVKLVGFDLNLIALGVICNFSHPLPSQFTLLLHSTRSTLGYPKWLTVRENNNTEESKNRKWSRTLHGL